MPSRAEKVSTQDGLKPGFQAQHDEQGLKESLTISSRFELTEEFLWRTLPAG